MDMHWRTELETRINNSVFTEHGVISLHQMPIRHFDSSLMADRGWYFHMGIKNGWSGPFKGMVHARGGLSEYLANQEDRLVRAMTGVADFTHSDWLKGYYRMRGEHVHIIRIHKGFISAVAISINRVERISLPEISSSLKESDSFMILKVEAGPMAQTVLLNPDYPVTILPATLEEEETFGLTAKSIREAIEMFNGLGHDRDVFKGL